MAIGIFGILLETNINIVELFMIKICTQVGRFFTLLKKFYQFHKNGDSFLCILYKCKINSCNS